MSASEEHSLIWRWNATPPYTVEGFVHHQIDEMTQRQPDAPAICAWDGELTYRQLDDMSTSLAGHLTNLGVGPGRIVLLCFEKSMWAPVTMLGVMKAGGASAALDVTQPEERLLGIIRQIDKPLIACSPGCLELASRLTKATPIPIDAASLRSYGPCSSVERTDHANSIKPNDPIYVVFTSGSTGAPKGVVITHSNAVNAVHHQRQFLRFGKTSRIFDFASYAFDASWSNFLHGLTAGGCLCIPSEHDRKNCIEDSMRQLRVNYADFTPTVAELLEPTLLPQLQVLVLGGESIVQERLACAKISENILNTYGPAECTIIVTGIQLVGNDIGNDNIGRGTGAVTWIVDPDNHNHLLPFGATGELLIEGPLVGTGYLNDPIKTSAAFIEDPTWLVTGGSGVRGRRGRLYKTGDLVRYNKDGTLSFVGRKDSQVKIRGQRVELSEVEHHVRRILSPDLDVQIVAEVVRPHDRNSQLLMVFLGPSRDSIQSSTLRDDVDAMTFSLNKSLAEVLPVYMIPSIYVPMERFPMTSTGKVDRRQLREIGALTKLGGIERSLSSMPLNEAEAKFAGLWACALGSRDLSFEAEHDFFGIGGDSIRAMKLVSLAKAQGFALSVSDIFTHPLLCDMALLLGQSPKENGVNMPTRVTPGTLKDVQTRVSRAYATHLATVEEIFPCTPIQAALFALSERDDRQYLGQNVYLLHPSIDLAKFKLAVEQVVQTSPILRTIILPAESGSDMMFQAVVKSTQVDWTERHGSVDYFLKDDIAKSCRFGDLTVRFALIADSDSGGNNRYFVLTAHHAVYDGWSLSMHLENVERVYKGSDVSPAVPFKAFVEWSGPHQGEDEYWKSQLSDFAGPDFPRLPSSDYRPVTSARIRADMQVARQSASTFTIASILRAAWAVTVATYSNTEDVVIGATLSGRNASFDGIGEVDGPTVTTVPVRLRPSRKKSIFSFLSEVQRASAEMIPFEHTGLQRISKMTNTMKKACSFKNLLVIQPQYPFESYYVEEGETYAFLKEVQSLINYSFGLVFECCLHKHGIIVNAIYDPMIMSEPQIRGILTTFEAIVQKMSHESTSLLGSLRGAGASDALQLASWAGNSPDYSGLIHQAISRRARAETAQQDAVCASDGNLSCAELDTYSSHLADYLVQMGLQVEQEVSLCMGKSKWAIVSILAILKAGGVYVPLDPSTPKPRLEAIANEIDTSICLTTLKYAQSCTDIMKECVIVEQYFEQLGSAISSFSDDHVALTPANAAYTIFTSGSTGVPKGVVVEHRALFCSAVEHGRAFGISDTTRALQFSSFTFDVSLTEILTTLLYGGCVCIPSDADRLNRLPQALTDLRVNWALLTPSVVDTIEPATVQTLETLVLAGEPMNNSHVRRWSQNVRLINGYGPTECCIFSVINSSGMTIADPTNIGRAVGCKSWVLDPTSYDTILPVGAIGELLLEGPILARGYLNDPSKTASSFIKNPAWASLYGVAPGSRLYRTGDLVYYNDEGNLIYIGRKDRQVKLHGQRMEIADVESHLRCLIEHSEEVLDVCVEIVKPVSSNGPHLAAFLRLRQGQSMEDILVRPRNEDVALLTSRLREDMLSEMPRYMVPTLFIPVHSMPRTSAGKLDRRQLRALVSEITVEELVQLTSSETSTVEPGTKLEIVVRDIWSDVLGLERTAIGKNNNFFGLGGDSLSALKFATKAQANGIPAVVSDLFRHRSLGELCDALAARSDEILTSGNDKEKLTKQRVASATDIEIVSHQLSIDKSAIQDVYEATSYQSIALVTTLLQSRGNINYYLFTLTGPLDHARLKSACLQVFQQNDILRTILTAHRRQIFQVVLRSPDFPYEEFENIDDPKTFAQEMAHVDLKQPIRLGTLMTQFAIVRGQNQVTALYLKLSHAQYDGMSLDIIRSDIERFYRGQLVSTGRPFAEFIRSTDLAKAKMFWKGYLGGSTLPQIINHSGPAYRNIVNCQVRKIIPATSLGARGITDSNLVKAAWAHTLARVTRNSDIVFGVLVSGRGVSMSNATDIAGPTCNHIPWRVQFQRDWTVQDYLNYVQVQHVMTIPFESTPFRRIIEEYTDWPKWSRFTSIVHHMAVLDIDSIQIDGAECDTWTFAPDADRTDVWLRSKVRDGKFDILLHSSNDAVPKILLEVLLTLVCDTLMELSANPDAPLKSPLVCTREVVPYLPLRTLPPRPEPDVNFEYDTSPLQKLVECAWDEILAPDDEDFKKTDIPITPDTPFYDLWGNMVAAQQFAEFYNGRMEGIAALLMEDILEHPSKRAQAALLQAKLRKSSD